MFRVIRFVLWTGFAMVLGAVSVSWTVAGATPLQHLTRAWSTSPAPAKVEDLKSRVSGVLEDAKDSLKTAEDHTPRERHSVQDRESVNKLIAKRGPAR